MTLMNPGDYDPRACGANCDECPLKGQVVVPPEIRPHAEVVVIGEAPGESEEKQLRPFVGPNGSEVDRALRAGGLHRGKAHFTSVLLCRPPENDLKKFLAVQKKQHKQLGTTMKTPMECCAPRLEQEIANHKHFIAMGKTAASAILGGNQSVMGLRGAVIDLEATLRTPERRVMVTLSPGLVLRQQRWAHVFRNDVAKAIRWFRGEVGWVEPDVTYNPPPAELEAFLNDPSTLYTYDIETDGIECLDANIRCIAIGTPEKVMVIGFRSNARPKEQKGLFLDYYTETVEAFAMQTLLHTFFEREDIVKVGHNSGYYDRIVMRERMGIEVKPNIDTMMLHRNVESELPHGLGYVASLYTEAPAWKTDREGNKLALGGESDRDLHLYCARDVAITARVVEPLVSQVALRQQAEVYKMDMKIQEICAVMHTTGMFVDQKARHEKELELLKTRHELLARIRDGVGIDKFNPVSVYQLRDLLFKDWDISTEFIDEKDRFTGSGDLSTGDLILRSLLTQGGIPEWQRSIIKLIRRYRKCLKVLGTYVVKLRPSNMGADLGWDEDEDWIDRETRKKYGEIKRGIVNPATGRMYPGYNAHVAVTGRLSSSKPINCFDGATEILTEKGWCRFDALEEGVRVAQWHDEGVVDFAHPTAYHKGHHTGKMVQFKSQSADLLMTPNHRIPLRKRAGILETVTAEELMTLGSGRKTIHAAHWLKEGPGSGLTRAELRLVVALHADGSFVHGSRGIAADMGFTKPRKIDRFREILSQVEELTWEERQPGQFHITPSEKLAELLGRINVREGSGNTRLWGQWVFSLSDVEAVAFERELWFWDGCWERKNQYANRDEANVDIIQTFLVMQGIRTNKRFYTSRDGNSVWILDVRRTTTNAVTPRAERSWVDWDDLVYCVTVPSDAIVVRRNGKVTITRQSQNFPKAMRSMVVPQPGNVLVGADMDQLELRIAAARWGVELYLRAFEEGKDPHSMTAFAVFGEEFCRAAGLDPALFSRPGILVGDAYINGKFEGSGDAKSMRDLSKAVQYACVDKDEPVAVLGPEGQKPISELQVGEWTWCWSRERNRYEPAEITEVMLRGQKECVRLTFSWWGGPRKGRCIKSVIVTGDHLCMLRDGTFRAAWDLQPDDRLMPFRRREGGTCGLYRRIFPFNDKRECNEHRVVMGFYEKNPTHVHHEDENTLNNNPGNLKAERSGAHYAIHKDSLDEGRRRSKKWLDSVTDADCRSAASKKMWARRRREGTDRFGSILDPFAERIGHEPDRVIAAEVGCTPQSVCDWRKRRGIPAYWKEAPGGSNHKVVSVERVGLREVWDIEVDHEDHNFPLAAGIFVHNSQYMAKVETVHKLIQKTELPAVDPKTRKPLGDGTTDLPYAKMKLKKVRRMRDNWLKGAPEFERGWEAEIGTFRDKGFLTEDVTGRRRDFLDGEAPNEIVNFPIQGSAAGLMNKALIDLYDAIPLHKWGPGTGIINQCHDAIVVECPESEAHKVAGLLEECLNQTDPGLPGVRFTATAGIGTNWKQVG